jgi:hypothetical protein
LFFSSRRQQRRAGDRIYSLFPFEAWVRELFSLLLLLPVLHYRSGFSNLWLNPDLEFSIAILYVQVSQVWVFQHRAHGTKSSNFLTHREAARSLKEEDRYLIQ